MRQHLPPSLHLQHPNMAAAPRSRTPCTAPEATTPGRSSSAVSFCKRPSRNQQHCSGMCSAQLQYKPASLLKKVPRLFISPCSCSCCCSLPDVSYPATFCRLKPAVAVQPWPLLFQSTQQQQQQLKLLSHLAGCVITCDCRQLHLLHCQAAVHALAQHLDQSLDALSNLGAQQ